MLIHASAFGIFAISVAVYTVFNAIYIFHITPKTMNDSEIACIAMNFLSFFAQLLLCVIFWQLGTAQPVVVPDDDEEIDGTVQVEEFDEEAELQRRIWNGFQREIRGLMDRLTQTSRSTA